ncbi:unnamed protein product [Dovyalis caffra]|uniref:Uncharacterized protein n=1 Tax=Dovyalis caffra TaxID=77055 RepID=A0AAV1SHY2_9ROSI|nr:unnamed protein product [Dovyalis caffra]
MEMLQPLKDLINSVSSNGQRVGNIGLAMLKTKSKEKQGEIRLKTKLPTLSEVLKALLSVVSPETRML